MCPAVQLAENRNGGEKNIWGIGNRPGQCHVFHAAVFIQLGKHMLLLNEQPRLPAEKDAADVKADFNADDFAKPGNQYPREQSEKGAVYSEKGNSGNT